MEYTLEDWKASPDYQYTIDRKDKVTIVCKASKKEGEYWLPALSGYLFKNETGEYRVDFDKAKELYEFLNDNKKGSSSVEEYEKLHGEAIIPYISKEELDDILKEEVLKIGFLPTKNPFAFYMDVEGQRWWLFTNMGYNYPEFLELPPNPIYIFKGDRVLSTDTFSDGSLSHVQRYINQKSKE